MFRDLWVWAAGAVGGRVECSFYTANFGWGAKLMAMMTEGSGKHNDKQRHRILGLFQILTIFRFFNIVYIV